MTISNTKMLIRYNAWTNQLLFESMAKLNLEVITDEEQLLIQKMIRVLNHIYIVDLIWQAHLEGYQHGITDRNPKEYPKFESLWQQQKVMDDWYIAWSDKVTLESLHQQVSFTLISGREGCMTRQEMLFHVVNHRTYHRGMVANLFTQMGLKAPATDLNVFLQHYNIS